MILIVEVACNWNKIKIKNVVKVILQLYGRVCVYRSVLFNMTVAVMFCEMCMSVIDLCVLFLCDESSSCSVDGSEALEGF